MQVSEHQPDGLHLRPQAILSQVAEDEILGQFAGGLVPEALRTAGPAPALSLAEALYRPDLVQGRALLVALIVLDAEIRLQVEDKLRILPLPGFLSYQARLPLSRFTPEAIRLPPLNPGGHYFFKRVEAEGFLSVRLDLHPGERLAGHVRVVTGRPGQVPQRMMPVEQRLERQVLDEPLIGAAVEAGDPALIEAEKEEIRWILRGLIEL